MPLMKNRSTISLLPKSLRQGKCKPIKRNYPVGQTLAGYPIIYEEGLREQTVQALRLHYSSTHYKEIDKLVEEANHVTQPEDNADVPQNPVCGHSSIDHGSEAG